MDKFGRLWDQQRKEQGFASQEQLDSFYRHYDHQKGCAECQQRGPGVELDDGIQPTMNSCAEADKLYAAYLQAQRMP